MNRLTDNTMENVIKCLRELQGYILPSTPQFNAEGGMINHHYWEVVFRDDGTCYLLPWDVTLPEGHLPTNYRLCYGRYCDNGITEFDGRGKMEEIAMRIVNGYQASLIERELRSMRDKNLIF